ncbi:MAG TPA: hypothetical protein DD827_10820 [Gammaproteobacteria bacterium]|jgi:type IV pilus assembly protein PilX|nr:hypothetical protein [Gammaproteobacteria bacterium]
MRKSPIIYSNQPKHQRERGVALIVGLVLVTALTLIGVTAVKLTTLDERIAANSQYKKLTFQAVESVLTEVATLERMQSGNFTIKRHYPAGIRAINDPLIQTNATLLSQQNIAFPGSSIGEGNAAPFKLRVFRIEGSSELEAVNAKAVHNLGVGTIVRP